MADPFVRQARGVFSATVGVAVTAGDLMFFDGTNWILADADDNTKFCEAIAVNTLIANDVGNLCLSCIVVDTDAPFTQGNTHYLSETAGANTATRPTTLASLRQVVGFALSTTELRLEPAQPHEHHESYNLASAVTTEGVATFNSGNFFTPTTNADAETITATWACPQNTVGLVFARLFSAAAVVSAATDLTILVSGARDGEQWDATTVDATLTTLVVSGAVADEIQGSTITTAMDAAGIIEPDNTVGFHGVHDGAQTDILHYMAIEVVYLVV